MNCKDEHSNLEICDIYRERVRPLMGQLMETLKFDTNYVHAYKDDLWAEDKTHCYKVKDFVGGYGSTILGHNSEIISQVIQSFIKNKRPIHDQGALRKESALLADFLNQKIKSIFNTDKDYVFTFTNSGAESVEFAIKHGMYSWRDSNSTLPPLFLALKKGFHGKTAGSLSATHNSKFSGMYSKSPINFIHISPELSNEELMTTINELSKKNKIVSFFIEPIQCEGGIIPIKREFIRSIEKLSFKYHFDLVIDEIQTGIYRTGSFINSKNYLSPPTHILLGKSLGMGIAKIGVCATLKEKYKEELSILHSSTFAEDGFSSFISLKGLEYLDSNESYILNKSKEIEKLTTELGTNLKASFPNLIKEVRSQGFLIGVDFNLNENENLPPLVEGIYQTGYIGYVLASYLLHRHKIRVGVTLSNSNTIRIEPSIHIEFNDIYNLFNSLNELCKTLMEKRLLHLTDHFWKFPIKGSSKRVSEAQFKKIPFSKNEKRVAFLSHVINEKHLRHLDNSFRSIDKRDRLRFLNKFEKITRPFCFHQQTICDSFNNSIVVNFYGIFLDSKYFEKNLNTKISVRRVQSMVQSAESQNCRLIGLGQYTSIVSNNGLNLTSKSELTTGNGLTAGSALLALHKVAEMKNLNIKRAKIGVFGASGNIGEVLSRILSREVEYLTFYYPKERKNIDRLQDLKRQLTSKNRKLKIEIETSYSSCKTCDILIFSTNSSIPFLKFEDFKKNSIVMDISVPSNLPKNLKQLRPDITVFEGGYVKLPKGQKIDTSWVPTFKGETFACLAETLLLGLSQRFDLVSKGPINEKSVLSLLDLAKIHGFEAGNIKNLSIGKKDVPKLVLDSDRTYL